MGEKSSQMDEEFISFLSVILCWCCDNLEIYACIYNASDAYSQCTKCG